MFDGGPDRFAGDASPYYANQPKAMIPLKLNPDTLAALTRLKLRNYLALPVGNPPR